MVMERRLVPDPVFIFTHASVRRFDHLGLERSAIFEALIWSAQQLPTHRRNGALLRRAFCIAEI
jgi:hypothetical protein